MGVWEARCHQELHSRCEQKKLQKTLLCVFLFCFVFFCFWLFRVTLLHMEVLRLGVESELQLPACTTATETRDLSRICDLHHSSWQLSKATLSKARDGTSVLIDTSWDCFGYATRETPYNNFKWSIIYKNMESLFCIHEASIIL